MKRIRSYQFFLWAAAGLVGFLAYREFLQMNVLAYVGGQNIWVSRRFLAFLIVSVISLGIYFSILITGIKRKYSSLISNLSRLPKRIRVMAAALLLMLPGLLKWTIPLPDNFSIGYLSEFFIIILVSALSASLFFREENTLWEKLILTASLIMAAGAAHSILYKLNSVTDYPFTLYWSEGNRFFDYSTLFGSYRYKVQDGEIDAFISWGMQLPWALPFIIPNLSIGFFRFWYQLVWILPGLILGYAAVWTANKYKVSVWFIAAFALWTYLFLDQGPIYAPLMIGAIFTVIAARQKTWLGAVIIFIISFYTRNARWTWAYAPGIWAGLLALMDLVQPTLHKSDWSKLVKPVMLGIAGYLGQLLPSFIRMLTSDSAIRLLPNPTASITRQPLLWDRLFPNPTYPPGILSGLAWATLPLVIWLVALAASKKWQINWLQKFAALVVAGVFLTVGTIASVKIGGGSNLHNLDMFLVTLTLIAASAIVHLTLSKPEFKGYSPLLNLLFVIALISPATYALTGGNRLALPPDEKTQETLTAVQTKVEEYSQVGEILFIDHRQLLTFNLVKDVPLVDEYEKKYLMDYAMAADAEYFNTFYEDLRNQRFVLIVNEPANIIIRGSEYSFGEENDAFVQWVTKPLLCTYEPIYTSFDTSVQLLIPRETPPPAEMGCQEILNY